ncbi:MAG: hypothetical protein ABH840_00955 [Nanoarchaeota archaeon]
MKKAGLLFSLILILSMISLVLVQAQELGDSGLPPEIEKLTNLSERATTTASQFQNQNSSYLKQEWKTIVSKNRILGPVFRFIDKVLEFMNPFFRIVLGSEYSLSWEFIFAIAIWFILFFILYPIIKAVFNSNHFISIIATFAVVSLIGLTGVIKKAVDQLSFMINNLQAVWISLAITLVILIILIISGKIFGVWIKKGKEQSEKEQENRDKKIIHKDAEVSKKSFENLK